MAAASATREAFGSRAGFILAAAGSAVGLGNMWRFPYQASEGGGAAFVLLYIMMTLMLGLPPATNLDLLGPMDKIAGELMLIAGVLVISILAA